MTEQNEALGGAALVEALQLGERQVHGPLAVFPLRLQDGAGPGYVTLREAIAAAAARSITEVSEGGSVPELRVVNKGDARVLVLDGEELRGAKQNRVLNTSILIGKHSSLVVPVSCTEQGRWSYASREFAESEIVADRQVRFAMKDSINASLASGAGHRSDQGRVWREVGALHGGTGRCRRRAPCATRTRRARPTSTPSSPRSRCRTASRGCWCCTARAWSVSTSSRARRSTPSCTTSCCAATPSRRWCGTGSRATGPSPTPSWSGSPTCPGAGTRARASAGTCATRAAACSGPPSPTAATRCTPRSSTSAACAARPGRHAGRRPAGPRRPRPDWRIADARERARRRQAR